MKVVRQVVESKMNVRDTEEVIEQIIKSLHRERENESHAEMNRLGKHRRKYSGEQRISGCLLTPFAML